MIKKYFFMFIITSLTANTCSAQEVRVEIQASAGHGHFVLQQEEIDYQKVIARNAAACGIGLFCGYLLKNVWLDVGRADEYWFGKSVATLVLMGAPSIFAQDLKAHERASQLSLITGTVLAFKHNL